MNLVLSTILASSCFVFFRTAAGTPADISTLLSRMEAAYSRVTDYRATVEVKTFKSDGSSEVQQFLYTFKKPKRIRLDFESPHQGMEMVYPDQNGKVTVHLPGLGHLLKFHLTPDNSFLHVASGQRIDQTDLGLLIENISHSLTDQRRGPVGITEEKGSIRIRVLAENHFRKGAVTLYHFFIDEVLWLPEKVEESSPDGHLERAITFQNLRVNIGIPDSFFELGGG